MIAERAALYDLIWKRTLASQMADAQLEKTKVTIAASGNESILDENNFIARGEVIKFDGFLKVYLEGSDDDEIDDPMKMKVCCRQWQKGIH